MRAKPFPAVCASSPPGTAASPADPIPPRQQSARIHYQLPKISLCNHYSFERSSCSPFSLLFKQLFLCTLGFCCLGFLIAGSIFIDFSHWAMQHTPHLWGSSFAGPDIPQGTGGRTEGQKMHDSFKLLLLSPSRTQVHGKHTKSIPFIRLILKKKKTCFSN